MDYEEPCCSKSLVDPSVDGDSMDSCDDHSNTIDNDCLQSILEFLPLMDKVRCERVCKTWQAAASRVIRGQKAIGNQETNFALIGHCNNSKHYVTSLDIIPKQILTNLSVLPRILQKFPELKAIAITRSKEPTFAEAANSKRQASDREEETRELTSEEVEPMHSFEDQHFPEDSLSMDMLHDIRIGLMQDPATMEFGIGIRRDLHSRNARIRLKELMMRGRKQMKMSPAPRPTNEEDFLDIIAKYASNLECIDITGLKMNRGYRSGTDEAGSWKLMSENLKNTLVHVKTYYMRDPELRNLLQKCSKLSDVSIIFGMRGDCLNEVGSHFRKLAAFSVNDRGLQNLGEAPSLSCFQELSLCNTSRSMISVISSRLNIIHTLNISLASTNVTPLDLSKLGKLKNLKFLYIKRRTAAGQFNDFDGPFIEIINHCNKLERIRLANMVVTDKSVRQVSQALPRLKSLEVKYRVNEGAKDLTDRSLMSLADLSLLDRLDIEYPNTFTENTLIDFLFKAFKLRYLLLHGCKELIPIKEILHAAVKQSTTPERQKASLSIDIDTREKMTLEVGVRIGVRPPNLRYTISTGEDFYSTFYPFERPVKESNEQDFDEHDGLLFGAE